MSAQALSRRGFLGSTGLGVAAFLAARGATAGSAHPNVVVILTDDQGWGDLSLHGNTNLHTPHIDSLARAGARFSRFYVCSVCAPTRAEFLTGRYHPRGGVRGVTRGDERLDLDEHTIADTFRAAGYATGAFGKWHNGTQYPYHPNGRGFDEFHGFASGHWGHYFDPVLEHNGETVRGKGYITDDLTNAAMAFMEAHREAPFFCYVPYNTPHSPFQVPDRFFDPHAEQVLERKHRDPEKEEVIKTRAALAMCENIDWNVGRILGKLADLGLEENTIVVYFSDNGPNTWRWNDGMKGRKATLDEGGLRVPCFVRWPGRIPPGKVIDPIAGAIDLLPTLAGMANIPVAGKNPLDGCSLVPLLTGTPADWPDRLLFSHQWGKTSVRSQRWRLDPAGQLYDMHADPGQHTDVAGEHPAVARRLREAVARWEKEVLPAVSKDDRPFPVGHPEFPNTTLPARDGVPAGQVHRSAKAPNCSYFTGWASTDDTITWDIEVATAGTYEATVYYTCPAEDVGATVELRHGASHVLAVVSEAHDPPLVGAEHDRAPRGSESLVKAFRPLVLGKIDLAAQRGPLVLRALEIPGATVMDVRAVTLRLLR